MSAPKLTPIPALRRSRARGHASTFRAPHGALRLLVALGFALQALPAQAQTVTTPVMSFPATNMQVEIDNVVKMQSDRLFINKRQCLGSLYDDTGTDDGTGTDNGTGTDVDAGMDGGQTDLDAGRDGGTPSDASTATPDAAAFIAQPKGNGEDIVGTDDSVEVTITVTNLGMIAPGANVLEFWMGMGSQDCFAPAGRQTVLPNAPPCKRINGVLRSIDNKKQVLNFKARDLFTDPYKSDRPDEPSTNPSWFCDLQGPWSLFIVPLTNDTPGSGMPGPALSNTLKINFEPDFTPLDPVTSVRGGRGETTVTVSWDMATGADMLTNYTVYFDRNAKAASDGECASSILVQGQNLPFDTAGLDGRTGKGTSLSTNPEDLGLAVNQKLPAAVVSLDAAGNTSLISNVVCVERVSTTGFWDACDKNENCKDGFDQCSLSVSRDHIGWAGWSLGALGLALWMRRRRSV